MSVFELKAAIPADQSAALADLLAELGEDRFMVLEDKPGNLAWITGYFESRDRSLEAWTEASAALGAAWPVTSPVVNELADADWKESYKVHFKAWQFGRLHWVPVWERDTFQLPSGESALWLDPGMAFGTGNHETTRLCCERLISFTEKFGTTGRLIDAGCGSGILALSGARLGFRRIAAFDNDPVAVEVSLENAKLNKLDGHVDFFTADLTAGLAGRAAELVMANIQADILVRHAEELCAAVAPGGQLVLSGILERELDQVREIFKAARPSARIESRAMGEWCDLALSPYA